MANEPSKVAQTPPIYVQSEQGEGPSATKREVVDVVWAEGTMAPRSVDGSIYTYRAGEIVTVEALSDDLRQSLGLGVAGTVPRDSTDAATTVGHVYKAEDFETEGAGPGKWNTGPLVPSKVEELNAEGIRASVHHVCGITPYYMISEGDPDPATREQQQQHAAGVANQLNLVLEIPADVDPERKPKVAFIDVGYLSGGTDKERTIEVEEGEMADDVPALGSATDDRRHDTELLQRAAGHGTFVGSIAATVAHRATFSFERAVTEGDAVVDERTVCEQLLQAANSGADVINLSLGCYGKGNQPPLLLERTLEHVLTNFPTLMIVAAAGNDGTRRSFWPASFATQGFDDSALRERIVSVGALDRSKAVTWANNGPSVRWFAPGTRVVGKYIGAPKKPQLRRNVNDDNIVEFYGYAMWEGSSHAAPYVAGLIARQMLISGESAVEAWGNLKKMSQAQRHTISLRRADEV